MANTFHDELNAGDIHVPYNLTYPDAANRIAGTNEGSAITVTADNIGQLAKQDDNDSLWMLTGVAPLTWLSIAPGTLWSRTGTVLSPATPGDTARVGDGTVSLPAWSFDSTTDMGMYRAGPLELGFAVNGTQYLGLSPAAGVFGALFSCSQAFLATNGSVSVPSYSFTSDQDTGWYSDSADAIKMGLGGVLKWTYGASSNIYTEPLLGPAGTVGAPAFSFSSYTSTGIYATSALQLDIACGGVTVGSFIQTGGLSMPDSLGLTGSASNIILESNTQTSGNVVSIKSTPGSASTAIVMQLEANGTNWAAGSRVLNLISDDPSALLMVGNDGVGDVFQLKSSGNINFTGTMTLTGGGTIDTTSNGDITLLPNNTGITKVGSGSTSHSLASNNDALVSGELEVDGVLWADSFIRMLSNNALGSDNLGLYGTFIPRNTNQTPDAPLLTTGTAANSFIICEFADRTTDFANALRTDPTFIFQSADATDITKRSYVSWNEMTIGGGKGSYLGIKSITEEVTVAIGTGSGGVATSGNLAPANSNIKGIACRVTQAAGGGAFAADIGITGSGNQDELIQLMSVTSTNTQVSPGGNDGTKLPIQNGSAKTLTITTDFDVTTTDLKIRIVTYYEEFTAPTS